MTPTQLSGIWLNAHIRSLLDSKYSSQSPLPIPSIPGSSRQAEKKVPGKDVTEVALKDTLERARSKSTFILVLNV